MFQLDSIRSAIIRSLWLFSYLPDLYLWGSVIVNSKHPGTVLMLVSMNIKNSEVLNIPDVENYSRY